jgi:S1-C subfamily serine protease
MLPEITKEIPMTLYLNLIFALMFFVTSCGKSSHKKKNETITPEQVTNLLDNQSFECASLDGSRCLEGIARVMTLNPKNPLQVGLCTGFLVRSNRLVTNHHCISTQEECASTFVSVFNGTSTDVAKCKTLIRAEDDGKPLGVKVIDVAVIEIDRAIGPTVVLERSRTVPSIGTNLSVWVVDHIDLFQGRMTELSCALKKRENAMELENCPIIAGNSGSPVLNKAGKVVGIIWGGTTSNLINEQTPLEKRRALSDLGYATQVKYFKEDF